MWKLCMCSSYISTATKWSCKHISATNGTKVDVFVEQWVSVVCGITAHGMCDWFEMFESACHFQIKFELDVRFEFESNLKASQVHKTNMHQLKPNLMKICQHLKLGKKSKWLNFLWTWCKYVLQIISFMTVVTYTIVDMTQLSRRHMAGDLPEFGCCWHWYNQRTVSQQTFICYGSVYDVVLNLLHRLPKQGLHAAWQQSLLCLFYRPLLLLLH